MLVLGAVPDSQLHSLRRARPARFAVAPARTWEEALATIRTRPVELAVVDPLLTGKASEREIERLRVMFPSLPFILYTTLTPETAAVLLALGQRGIRHVVFVRYNDFPARLRHVLAEEEARSTSRQLLDQLAWALAPLPSELRWVLEEVLQSPAQVQTVQQVAARARVDRRTFERWFTRVGLPSPRHFLAAARVLYAHRLLQDPGFTIEDVAERLGYAQTKTLQLHARTYLRLTVGEMRLMLTPEDALQRVARGFVLSPPGAQVPVGADATRTSPTPLRPA
ncbi:MAG TPA: helix-turn-helix domain-containing protein [Gemmatimonadales bacterium]|jgi:AraC-like DNA-binding protein